jgi:hypothetical protein
MSNNLRAKMKIKIVSKDLAEKNFKIYIEKIINQIILF